MFFKEKNLTIAFFIAFALLLLTSGFSVQSIRTLVNSDEEVNHTFEVRLGVQDVISLLNNAETSQLGFIITGDEKYLELYNQALPKINSEINQLKTLTADNEDQQSRISQLQSTVINKLEEMQIVISLYRTKGFLEAQKRILIGKGKFEMDNIRLIVNELNDAEMELFDQRQSVVKQSQFMAWITLGITSLVNFGLLTFLFFYIKGDLDHRVTTAENLRASQELTQETINSLEEHIAVVNRSGDIIVINKAWENFVKENTDDLCELHDLQTKMNFREIYQIGIRNSENDLKTAIEGITKVLNGEVKQFNFEYPCETKTEEKWFLVNVTPLSQEDNGVVISQTDITYLKNFEKERENVLAFEISARTELENLNRTKDEFLATVSHELRTPLNAILGWATMLKEGEFDSETQLRALESIERNARTQVKLTEDLLDVSRIIAGKVHFEIQPVNPIEILNASIDSMQLAANAKHIEIKKHFDESGFLIAADANRLLQIFWNLLLNAIKFTEAGGTLEIILEKTEKTAKISIRDSGIGISDEFLTLIFERFRQADGTITRKYGGLGLGLAIVKNLVELHGGTVKATSEGIGKGSTFVVEIPLIIQFPLSKSNLNNNHSLDYQALEKVKIF